MQRAIVQAEEKYLADPTATLGTWFARVQETVAVATRVALDQIEESSHPCEAAVADELVGVFADACAEAIRAACRSCDGELGSDPKAGILRHLAEPRPGTPRLSWPLLLVWLARCSAALEPIAAGLREADVQMEEADDRETVTGCFLQAAGHAFGGVHALC